MRMVNLRDWPAIILSSMKTIAPDRAGATRASPKRTAWSAGRSDWTNDFERCWRHGAARFPTIRRSPFVLAGADAPMFDRTTAAGEQNRVACLYTGDADFGLQNRILRTEHRGMFFNSATFNADGLNGRFTNNEEPSVVFGYSF